VVSTVLRELNPKGCKSKKGAYGSLFLSII